MNTSNVIRAYEATIDSVLEGERSVVARINTATIDEYRTIIEPMGGDLRDFNTNPPVLWQHGKEARGSLPIGRGWVKARRSENDLIGKCMFAKDDFSQQLFEMYQDGTLRGWSINMIPTEMSPPTAEEIRSRPGLAECQMIYRKWKLKEFSAVAIPGNNECLTMLVSRGMIAAPDGFELRTMTESSGMVKGGAAVKQKCVKQRGSKWCAYDEDGGEMGEFDTREAAEACITPKCDDKPKATGKRHIDTDGARWWIVEPDGSVIHPRFTEARDAEALLKLISQPAKDFAAMAREILSPLAAQNEAFARDVAAYIDLKRNWRV